MPSPIPAPPPFASATVAGLVSTTTQTFAGDKTLDGKIYINVDSDNNISFARFGQEIDALYGPGPLGAQVEIYASNPGDAGAGLSVRAVTDDLTNGSTSQAAVYGESFALITTSYNYIAGGSFYAEGRGTGAIGSIHGLETNAKYIGSTGGSVTDVNAFHVYPVTIDVSGGGSAGNATGIYIEDQAGLTVSGQNNAIKYAQGSKPFVLRSDGAVGIGTSSPSQLLHVNGKGLFSDILGLAQIATGSLPTASSFKAYIVYDSSVNQLKYSDGSSWLALAAAAGAVTGSGASGELTYWNGTSTVTGSSALTWDNTNKRLSINTPSPTGEFNITKSSGTLQIVTNNPSASDFTSLTMNTDSGGATLQVFGSTNADAGIVRLRSSLLMAGGLQLNSGSLSNGIRFYVNNGVSVDTLAATIAPVTYAATFVGAITASNFNGTLTGTNTGDVSLTAIGSSPNNNGASLSGQVLTLQPADATHGGLVSSGTQTFGGAKTFASATVSGALTADSTTLVVDATNHRVGVGTASPGVDLDVFRSSGTPQITVRNTADTSSTPTVFLTADAGSLSLIAFGSTSGKPNVGQLRSETGLTGGLRLISGANANGITMWVSNGSSTDTLAFTLAPSTFAATVVGALTASNFSGSSSGTNTGDISLAAIGSSPNNNGASLSGQVLTLQPADGTHGGLITSGTQTLGGAKTFSSTIAASNLSGTNTGDLTLAAVDSSPNANGASLSGQVLTLQPADATHPGVVSTGAQSFGGAKSFGGVVESTSGGFKFPDTTTQTTAVIVLSATASWTPAASLAAGQYDSTTVTLTGVAIGYPVMAGFSGTPSGCICKAEVLATNTVTIYLWNISNASVSPSAGTITVKAV